MKAVIWTDVFQSVIMVSGLVAVIVQVRAIFSSLEKILNISHY